MRSGYTARQIEFIADGYKKMPIPALTRAFNNRFKKQKTETAIRSLVRKHGIKSGRAKGNPKGTYRVFNPAQARFIKQHYKHSDVAALTGKLNRKFKTKFTEQQVKSFVHNHKIDSGRTGRFEKGIVPWNKGVKGSIKPNSGSFKKGNRPQTWLPVGSEVMSTDGYLKVKIAEPNKWQFKHILAWEEAHGKVKPGQIIIFIDGDHRDCSIDNLTAINRAELLYLNRNKFSDLPPYSELRQTMINLARLEARRFSIRKKNK